MGAHHGVGPEADGGALNGIEFGADLSRAMRRLARARSFSAIAVLTLELGAGPVGTVYAVVKALWDWPRWRAPPPPSLRPCFLRCAAGVDPLRELRDE